VILASITKCECLSVLDSIKSSSETLDVFTKHVFLHAPY